MKAAKKRSTYVFEMDEETEVWVESEFLDGPDIKTRAALKRFSEWIGTDSLGINPHKDQAAFNKVMAVRERLLGYKLEPITDSMGKGAKAKIRTADVQSQEKRRRSWNRC